MEVHRAGSECLVEGWRGQMGLSRAATWWAPPVWTHGNMGGTHSSWEGPVGWSPALCTYWSPALAGCWGEPCRAEGGEVQGGALGPLRSGPCHCLSLRAHYLCCALALALPFWGFLGFVLWLLPGALDMASACCPRTLLPQGLPRSGGTPSGLAWST